MRDLKSEDEALLSVIVRRYDTFNKFKEKFNIGGTIKKVPKYGSDKILSLLVKFSKEYGKIPKMSYFRHPPSGYMTDATIRNNFGSFNRAMHMAGFASGGV